MSTLRTFLFGPLLLAGCDGQIGETLGDSGLSGERSDVGVDDATDGSDWQDYGADVTPPYSAPPSLPSVALCGSQSLGRSYSSVLGGQRESDRLDQAAGVERDKPIINTKWYKWELQVPLDGTFLVEAGAELSAAGTVATFNGSRAERQFGRLILGPMTPVKLFQLGFTACVRAIQKPPSYSYWQDPKFSAAPTVEGAAPFCAEITKRAWARTPRDEEVAACAELATSVVADDPNPIRQWAYVCGAVVAAAEFITR